MFRPHAHEDECEKEERCMKLAFRLLILVVIGLGLANYVKYLEAKAFLAGRFEGCKQVLQKSKRVQCGIKGPVIYMYRDNLLDSATDIKTQETVAP